MRILITGVSGYLGHYLLRHLSSMPHHVTAWSGSQSGELFSVQMVPVPLTDADAIRQAFLLARPDVVIHAGALASVAKCFDAPETAWRVNVDATGELVELASQLSARFVLASTDLVFDGRQGGYREVDETRPLSFYGRTKLAAEQATLAYEHATVVRVSLLFGPALGQRRSFFDDQVDALKGGQSCRLFSDEWRTPLAISTAASALVGIAQSDVTGLLHLGGPERMSRLAMGQCLARVLKCDPAPLVAATRESVPADEKRPRDTSLDSSRWRSFFPDHPWPGYEAALKEMIV